MRTARVAAREKLSRDVMEMTAEVKHRLKALSTVESGAEAGVGLGMNGCENPGIAENKRNNTVEFNYDPKVSVARSSLISVPLTSRLLRI